MTTSIAKPLRRAAPVLCLLFLSPWVGEFLLGNVPAGSILALPFLVPLYGGGALLIREAARRTGRSWPTILILGMAYGVIEAGLVDQSLFNANFEGNDFQKATRIPALGIGASDAISFILGHAIWSIAVPIAIAEMLAPSRRAAPWLGRIGLAAAGAVYLCGCAIIFVGVHESEGFLASKVQMLGAAALAVVLIAIAFAIRRRPLAMNSRPVPRPWLLGVGTFAVASVFFARPEDWLGGVVLAVALVCGASIVVAHWSRQQGWSVRHEFAVTAGALLTYAWGGFALTALIRPDDTVARIGNVVFALIAVALLAVTARSVREKSWAPIHG